MLGEINHMMPIASSYSRIMFTYIKKLSFILFLAIELKSHAITNCQIIFAVLLLKL